MLEHGLEVLGGRRDELPQFVVEDGQPHPVPLGAGEGGQAARQETRVVQLPDAAPAEVHGTGDIDGDQEVGIRVSFEFLHVEAVGAREETPVESPDVVSGHVGPVLREIDGTPEEGRTVQAADEALHDHLGHQRQVRDPGERHGVDESRLSSRHRSMNQCGQEGSLSNLW